MKLLLVDDEQFTRQGILSITPWKDIGITEVITAIDGEDGLQKALASSPDIILTDVRMPIMDGVSMSFKIREKLSSCCIIFMSGYADKEYLKSAIRLSAINYIEKPFQPLELQATLRIAVEKCRTQEALQNTASEIDHKLNLSLPTIKNEIASLLLKPIQEGSKLQEYLQIAYPEFDKSGSWITFLIFLFGSNGESPAYATSLQASICDLLNSRFALSEFANVIIGEKSEQVIVVHMNLKNQEGKPSPNFEIGNICYMLCDILKSTCSFLLATGHPVAAFEEIYESYQAASICLQRGFFHKKNSVLFYEEKHNHLIYQFSDSSIQPFEKAMSHHDEAAAVEFIKSLVEKLRRFDGTLVSSVKIFFLQIMRSLYEMSALCKSHAFTAQETIESLSESIWEISFLSDLESYVLEKLTLLFQSKDDQYAQYPLAYRIRLYIDENYENESLSLQEIASCFSVSESYLCIIFRKAFDDTINQYMINRRIEKAKEYLQNSNKKIKEISELVGYRDCNYFIRIFKKNTGMTPADFRTS